MPFSVNITDPLGGLDTDTDLAKVRNGDYTDAKNISHISQAGQTSWALENTLGNKYRFTIPATTQQNKIYRVTLGQDGVTNHTINFFWTDGSAMASATYTEAASYAGTDANMEAAVTAALTASLYHGTAIPQTVTFFYGFNTTTIEIDTVLGYEYSLTSDLFTNAVVMQEAISLSLCGEANVIGSYDLLEDLFIWSTPQKKMPDNSLIISQTTNTSPITITASGPSGELPGLTTGDEVVISGVLGNTAANGRWIIQVTGVHTFSLFNSAGNGIYTGQGTVLKNSQGIGEIGVGTYDPNTDIFSYTRLLKSKEFNFRTKKQIDTYCEANNFRKSLYFTDDYNLPRIVYYSGAYIQDGGINPIDSNNIYFYGNISSETQLVITNELIGFSFTNQQQTGGGIISGNWRYAVRLLTKTFSPTNWTDLSNPINVYKALSSDGKAVCGDDAGTVTSKINTFSLTNLPANVFDFVELAAVHYAGSAIVGSIIKRVQITSSSMSISHLGTETDVTNLDVSTLNQSNFDILTAKNIDAIDNRLILSNLTTSAEFNFSTWTASWKHSLFKKSIDAVRYSENGTFRFGEYADFINVNRYVSYMYNETYRFFAKFKLIKTGFITKGYWIDDIKFDTTTPTRRNNTLANYDLTDAAGNTVYVAAVTWENIDLNFLINGVPARDLIEAMYIERVECVPEVLVSGLGVLGIRSNALAAIIDIQPSKDGFAAEYNAVAGAPFLIGEQVPYNADNNFNAYGTYPNTTKENSYVSVYCPDLLLNNSGYTFQAGDVILNIDQPIKGFSNNYLPAVSNNYYSVYFEFTGNNTITTPQSVAISSAQLMPFGTTASIGGNTYSKILYRGAAANGDNWSYVSSLVVKCAAGLTHTNGNPDWAHYNVQIFRAITDKYGDKNLNQTIPTGAFYKITSASPAIIPVGSGIDTYGGDVFNQKFYIKNRFATNSASFGTADLGFTQGFSFYSQNRVNSQMMRRYNSTSKAWLYPGGVGVASWLADITTIQGPYYDIGYDIKNGVNSNVAFDSTLPDQSDLPTQIRYSDLKPQNSVIDNFRMFLPLNFKDLPLTWGEIIHHANYNGELFTWQPRMVQRQYFNTRGTMSIGGGANTDVLIGDGTVFSRDGQMITTIGTFHKWSVIKGRSKQGNDVIYWLNTELKKAMRMGYDGTISVGDVHGMQSFFANNLKWVSGKDTPADGEGICGTWDDRYVCALWTVRGKRVFPIYSSANTYSIASVVYFVPAQFSTFEQTGEFYVSLQNGNIGHTPPNFGSTSVWWQMIPHTGSVTINGTIYNGVDYYNEYTLEFNEQKNKFTTFYTFKPKIYLKWTDAFLTPRPISDTGRVYEHRLGRYCIWYDQSSVVQSENGFIELLFNKDENLIKEFFAILINSKIVPLRIDYYTQKQQTFVVAADFETDIDFWIASIKNDILTSSNGISNDEDTTRLFGQWLKVKISYETDVYQKVVDIATKFLGVSRTYNK